FWGRSFYAGNDCDFWVYEISLEPVEKSYGASQVPTLGTVSVSKTEDNTPDDTNSENILLPDLEKFTGTSGKSLGEVLSDKEIDTISQGLRALGDSVDDAKAGIGLHKLAEALQRLKHS